MLWSKGRSLYPASPAFPGWRLKTQRAKYKERRKQIGRSMAGALFAVDGAVDEAPVVAVAVAVAAAL